MTRVVNGTINKVVWRLIFSVAVAVVCLLSAGHVWADIVFSNFSPSGYNYAPLQALPCNPNVGAAYAVWSEDPVAPIYFREVAAPFTVPTGCDYQLDKVEIIANLGTGFIADKSKFHLRVVGPGPTPINPASAVSFSPYDEYSQYFNFSSCPTCRYLVFPKFAQPPPSMTLLAGNTYWVIFSVECTPSGFGCEAGANWMASLGPSGTIYRHEEPGNVWTSLSGFLPVFRVIGTQVVTPCVTCADAPVTPGRPDAWIRDNGLDDSGDPSNGGGNLWASPDIWVRNTKATRLTSLPGRRFTSENYNENPEYATSLDNKPWVYAKVCNHGTQAVSGDVHLYWASASTGLNWDIDWTEILLNLNDLDLQLPIADQQSTHVDNLQPGDIWVVDRRWQDIPQPDANQTEKGHFCLLARFVSDPSILPFTADPIIGEVFNNGIWGNVRQSSNIAWRNITIVDENKYNLAPPGEGDCERFILRNIRTAAPLGTQALGDLIDLEFSVPPEELSDPLLNHGRVIVHLGPALFQQWQMAGGGGDGFAIFDDQSVEIIAPVAHLTGIPMQAREEHVLCLEFWFPPDPESPAERRFGFSVIQSVEGASHPDGGITYDIRLHAPCFANGDVNGDGIILTVADLVDLIKFVNFGVVPNGPLYQMDLNGDGFIDQADIDIFKCYFISGNSCFPVFPVPTDCNPSTVRGCCLTADGFAAIRSPQNCAAAGGTYNGDGSHCRPDVCIDTVSALNGQVVSIIVIWSSGDAVVGGFDLLISYDPSALTFVTATRGALLDSLEWEYFTFRTGVNGNCGGGCPSGLVHLIAIADLDNGSQNHPIISAAPGELAVLQFRVSSDRNLIGQCAPVRFYWNDCGDNTFSSVSGDTTYFDRRISDPLDNLLWDEDNNVQFPESARPHGLGAPDSCLTGGGPGKPAPIREIDFCNGWVCIRLPIDDRGDINQNGVANEIGDAVLFSNFFIYGIDHTFAPPGDQREAQKLATDINDDGIVLTIADLVYLIRIITGDAQPFPAGGDPKLTPYQQQAGAVINVGASRVTVTANSPVDLGGAVFTFRYSGLTVGTPILSNAASQMVVQSKAERGELRVLVAPMMDVRGARIGAGANEILSIPTEGNGTIELVDVQMSDAEGNLLTTSASKNVPTEYTLLQNYPNPFNAGTIIQFGLKDATDWKLNVYNITGQTVRSFSGHGQGQVQVAWDGTDNHGRSIASGVYFYRLETKAFTATKKMTLMK